MKMSRRGPSKSSEHLSKGLIFRFRKRIFRIRFFSRKKKRKIIAQCLGFFFSLSFLSPFSAFFPPLSLSLPFSLIYLNRRLLFLNQFKFQWENENGFSAANHFYNVNIWLTQRLLEFFRITKTMRCVKRNEERNKYIYILWSCIPYIRQEFHKGNVEKKKNRTNQNHVRFFLENLYMHETFYPARWYHFIIKISRCGFEKREKISQLFAERILKFRYFYSILEKQSSLYILN